MIQKKSCYPCLTRQNVEVTLLGTLTDPGVKIYPGIHQNLIQYMYMYTPKLCVPNFLVD